MNDFVELRKVLAIVARRWWLLILVTGMMAAGGYLVSQRQTRVYEGSVTLLVGPLLQGAPVDRNDILVSETLAQTYAKLARGQPVLQGAIDTLNLTDSWTALRSQVSVVLVEETQLLQIGVLARSQEEARITADEVARQLILLSPTASADEEQDENEQFVRQRLSSLRSRIEAGQNRLETLEAREAGMVGSLSAEQLQEWQNDIATLEGLIAAWENSYGQLLTYIRLGPSPNLLTVVEPAHADSRPIRPRPLMNTVIAGAIGLGLALGLVFLLEFVDDTLKSTDELDHALGLTALGTISRIKSLSESSPSRRFRKVILPRGGWPELVRTGSRGEHHPGKLIVGLEPSSTVAEAFRIIRSNIQFVTADRPAASLLVTSPASGEGKSIVVANLGVVMAQSGLRTILVDANLRQPVLDQLFDVSSSAGLTDLLCSTELELTGLLADTEVEHLQVLTSGETSPNPSDLIGSERMGQLLTELNELADVVILDSPPVLASTDAAVLANRVDGVVMVIESGRTSKEAARHAVQSLQLANPSLIGAILNRGRVGGAWIAAGVLRLLWRLWGYLRRGSRGQRRWPLGIAQRR